MEILVLGGTGAMGAPVVQILADQNNHVVVTTRQNKKSHNKNIQFVQGDAHDLNFVMGLLDKPYDAVIDFMIYTPDEFLTFILMYWNSKQENAQKFVGQKKATYIWKRRIITRFIVTESMIVDFPM